MKAVHINELENVEIAAKLQVGPVVLVVGLTIQLVMPSDFIKNMLEVMERGKVAIVGLEHGQVREQDRTEGDL